MAKIFKKKIWLDLCIYEEENEISRFTIIYIHKYAFIYYI